MNWRQTGAAAGIGFIIEGLNRQARAAKIRAENDRIERTKEALAQERRAQGGLRRGDYQRAMNLLLGNQNSPEAWQAASSMYAADVAAGEQRDYALVTEMAALDLARRDENPSWWSTFRAGAEAGATEWMRQGFEEETPETNTREPARGTNRGSPFL